MTKSSNATTLTAFFGEAKKDYLYILHTFHIMVIQSTSHTKNFKIIIK